MAMFGNIYTSNLRLNVDYTEFIEKFYKALIKSSENLIMSPCSTYALLHIAAEGSDEPTKQFLDRMFSYSLHRDGNKELLSVNSVNKERLCMENKLFLDERFKLQSDFSDYLKDCPAELEILDFSKPESQRSINVWINNRSNEQFNDLLGSPSVNNSTHFNFDWANKFDASKTTSAVFHINKINTIDVQMMKTEGSFNFRNDEHLDAKVLELPVTQDDLSVFIILPNQVDGLDKLEENLFRHYHSAITQMEKVPVKLSLPKFKVKQSTDVTNLLSEIPDYQYMKNQFNFDKLNTVPLYNSKIMTKCIIEVMESYVYASAISGFDLLLQPFMQEMNINTTIANRFAKTLITSLIKNIEKFAKESTFSIILPEQAFISEFVMEIEGKSYKSYVKEKEEAKQDFEMAVSSGRSAGHVAVTARDSNKFTVTVNVEPNSDIKLLLTYEELLQRRFDQYELVMNVNPGYIVDNLHVEVKIEESRPLKFVKTPPIRSGNDISENVEAQNKLTSIEISGSTAVVKFNPSIEEQKELALKLGNKNSLGVSGQLIVQYDVELDPKGEILLQDGYFVHFFAPPDLPVLPTHVVFALDTSGSMSGRKIEQLKDAMKSILDQIRTNDLVSILDFNTNIQVWDINRSNVTTIRYNNEDNYRDPFSKLTKINLPTPSPATGWFITQAKNAVDRMHANNSTHMIGGIETALYLVKLGIQQFKNHQPILVFLTDGQPTDGIASMNEIVDIVTGLNAEHSKVPIFSLSFGGGADKNMLRQLSLKNFGFSRHIYEAADASLQLQQFYKQISSPALSNITFKYESEVENVTRVDYPIYFAGSDIVISGRYKRGNKTTIQYSAST